MRGVIVRLRRTDGCSDFAVCAAVVRLTGPYDRPLNRTLSSPLFKRKGISLFVKNTTNQDFGCTTTEGRGRLQKATPVFPRILPSSAESAISDLTSQAPIATQNLKTNWERTIPRQKNIQDPFEFWWAATRKTRSSRPDHAVPSSPISRSSLIGLARNNSHIIPSAKEWSATRSFIHFFKLQLLPVNQGKGSIQSRFRATWSVSSPFKSISSSSP